MLLLLLMLLLGRLVLVPKHHVAGGEIAVDDAGGVHAADGLADAVHQIVDDCR